jgi:hypothetical protein
MAVPVNPKIYHIVHMDKLGSIIGDGHLWSDAIQVKNPKPGTVIGMNDIKARRLNRLQLTSRPGLFVGQCVPFYFCPRSVMLYLLFRGNREGLCYRGGQQPIIHLEADLHTSVSWAEQTGHRWAFTLSNAGANYFEDRCDLGQLNEIDWAAVAARDWSRVRDGKQAEFLVEHCFPWHLVERIGVHSSVIAKQVASALKGATHRPRVEVCADWYY